MIVRALWVGVWMLLASASHADTIYVVRRGWHIDVGFAVPELVGPLATGMEALPGARYLLFGFGDRRYLMAKHSHVPAMLGAILPGRALILVTGLVATPAEAFGNTAVVAITVSSVQSAKLQAFIVDSLEAHFDVIAPGPYPGSVYYGSTLKYSGFHTCNTWAAEGLRRAGLPVRSRGILFAGQLWKQVSPLGSRP